MKLDRIVSEEDVVKQGRLMTAIMKGSVPDVLDFDLDKIPLDLPAYFDGQPPLAVAISLRYTDIARILIVHGADINGRLGVNGPTPLMLASALDDMTLVELLIDHGAHVNDVVLSKAVTTGGYTALHFAGAKMATGSVEVLMRHHADSYIKGFDDKDVIELMRDTLVTGSTNWAADKRAEAHRAYAEMSFIIEGLRNERGLEKEL